jgi:hypothetical protein
MKRKNKSSKRSPKVKKVKEVKVETKPVDFDDTCDRCKGTGIWQGNAGEVECINCKGTGHTGEDKTPIEFSGGAFEFPKKNKDYEDHKQMWKKWWKPLLKATEDPSEDVMKELADYAFILDQVSTVYCEITGGKLSKPNYPARVVLTEYEQDISDNYLCREDIESIVNDDNLTAEQKVQEIIKYLY